MKILLLRRPDICATCRAALSVGDRAAWDATARSVLCLGCYQHERPGSQPDVVNAQAPCVPQQAGTSAQREYTRRSEAREQRVRAAHPKLGGLLLALNKEPMSTRVWAQGAAGERAVGTKLDELAGNHAVVLHDRSLRRADGRPSRANIDHIAVAATGVWVIDAKTHKGALEVRRSGGWLTEQIEQLYIGGRDQTRLVHGVQTQVAAVEAELARVEAPVPVRGVMCFVGTELPWLGSRDIAGIRLLGRRALAKLLTARASSPPTIAFRRRAISPRAFRRRDCHCGSSGSVPLCSLHRGAMTGGPEQDLRRRDEPRTPKHARPPTQPPTRALTLVGRGRRSAASFPPTKRRSDL